MIDKAAEDKLFSDFREHARTMEAVSFDFLNAKNERADQSGRWMKFRVTFVDGKVFTLPRRFEDQFKVMTFKLRPARDDA